MHQLNGKKRRPISHLDNANKELAIPGVPAPYKKRHPGGRPTKRTPNREILVLKAIANGLPLKVACQLAGLGFTTFNDWRQQDSLFAEKVELAEAQAIRVNIAFIQKAALKDWKAAAWLLERRHPDMFARPEVQLNQQICLKTQKENSGHTWWQNKEGKSPAIDISGIKLICSAEDLDSLPEETSKIGHQELTCAADQEDIRRKVASLDLTRDAEQNDPKGNPETKVPTFDHHRSIHRYQGFYRRNPT